VEQIGQHRLGHNQIVPWTVNQASHLQERSVRLAGLTALTERVGWLHPVGFRYFDATAKLNQSLAIQVSLQLHCGQLT
jgi:hypothetical protein